MSPDKRAGCPICGALVARVLEPLPQLPRRKPGEPPRRRRSSVYAPCDSCASAELLPFGGGDAA